jgi:predicted nucleic acid-binding protein
MNNYQLIETMISIRKNFRIKLPDAIIAGSAINRNAILVTRDAGFLKIASLQVLSY